ncbi:TrmB family transcriptional regulator [Paenalcaligenes sp. Me52]|uniref:TrmB family transcriptional regulator n=1 Tax=Paenalcaligenes sp. Me52 TaxID=3392038 RepID=UPI003D2A8FB1
MDLKEKLARLGITGNLYKVYCAIMELGDTTVTEVATRANIARTTCADAITRLANEGLVQWQGRGRDRSVSALNPGVLLEHIAARRELIEDLLPELRSIYNRATGKPQIRFYEGAEGVKTVLWDSLRCKNGPLLATFSMSELEAVPGLDEITHYQKERLSLGLSMRVIRSASKDVQHIWPNDKTRELRELRFTPPSITLSMTTLIYDNCVASISSKKENYGLIIESEEYANFQRAMYEVMWQSCIPATDLDQH